MCERKAVLESLSIVLLEAESLCVYQPHTEKKVGHHSKIKNQDPSENEYKKFCFNGGDCN